MFIIARIFTLLLLAACLTGCPVPSENRPLAAVVGTRAPTAPKPGYAQMEAILAGLTQRLYAAGLSVPSPTPGYRPAQPFSRGNYLTGERLYSAGFYMEPRLGCVATFDRKEVRVTFYEQASPPYGSHVFPASDAQRRAVRALASQIEGYLHASLPSSYHVSVTYTPPAT